MDSTLAGFVKFSTVFLRACSRNIVLFRSSWDPSAPTDKLSSLNRLPHHKWFLQLAQEPFEGLLVYAIFFERLVQTGF
jgi:hypothetical protein